MKKDVVVKIVKPKNFPKIVCLCGSTMFIKEFQEHYARLTDEGCIVLTVGRIIPQHEQSCERKKKLDELHLRKIDLADEIFVICHGEVTKGRKHIGESTTNEMVYAYHLRKPIRFSYKEQALIDNWTRQPVKEIKEAK